MIVLFRVCVCVLGSISDVDRECGVDVIEERFEFYVVASF